jgi:hypothetical protein
VCAGRLSCRCVFVCGVNLEDALSVLPLYCFFVTYLQRREIEDTLECVVKDIEAAAREEDARLRACAQALDSMLRKIVAVQGSSHSSSSGGGIKGGTAAAVLYNAAQVKAAKAFRPGQAFATAPFTSHAAMRQGPSGSGHASAGDVTIANGSAAAAFAVPSDIIVTIHMMLGARVLPAGTSLGIYAHALRLLVPAAAAATDAAAMREGAPAEPHLVATADATASGFVRDRSTNQSFTQLEQWVSEVVRRQEAARVDSIGSNVDNFSFSDGSALIVPPPVHPVPVSRALAYEIVSVLARSVTISLLDIRSSYSRRLSVIASALQSSPERLLHWHAQTCEHERRPVELPTPTTIFTADGGTVLTATAAPKRKRPVVVPAAARAAAAAANVTGTQQPIAGGACFEDSLFPSAPSDSLATSDSFISSLPAGSFNPPAGAPRYGEISAPKTAQEKSLFLANRRAKQDQLQLIMQRQQAQRAAAAAASAAAALLQNQANGALEDQEASL